MKFLILAVVLFAYANAHTCMIFPQQRGYLDPKAFTTAGADVCNYEKPAPCGGMKQEDPEVSFEPGEEITVTFQKNLDHFNSGGPGYFEVSFWGADFPNGTSLIKVPDSADIKTLEVWNVNVTLPKLTKPEPKGILQLVYSTNNPNAPPFFYQCADIHLMKKM